MGLTQVSTDGVKNDAITKTKIPANQIEASELADNAVDTAAIADNAVTTNKIGSEQIVASNIAGGTITAGKLASGVQTTINSNADNRVITGSGTANTLEGESGLTYNGNTLSVANAVGIANVGGTLAGSGGSENWMGIKDSSGNFQFITKTHGTNVGSVGIGTTSPAHKLHVEDSVSNVIVAKQTTNNGGFNTFAGVNSFGNVKFYVTHNGRVGAADGIIFGSDTAAANILNDYEEGYWSPTAIDGQALTVQNTGNVAARRYIKIGKLVTCYFDITYSGSNSSANFRTRFSGLPFSKEANSEGAGGALVLSYFDGPDSHQQVLGHVDSSNLMGFYKDGDGLLSYSNSAGYRFAGCFTYVTT